MHLSSKIIYQILNLEDPQIFKEKMIVNNLFNLHPSSKESDIFRHTGKTTSLIINIIPILLEKNKTILICCKNQQHAKFISNNLKNILLKVNKIYPIKFIENNNNQFNFKELNSTLFIRYEDDPLWSKIKYDVSYRDI
jgi:hypothetical protein